jgi:N-acyl-D-amino-acid deacylase
VKFAVAFDRPDDCPLMSTTFAKMMFVPDDVEQVKPDDRGIKRYYAHGWKIVMYADGKFNCYHMGLLEGSQALLVRRNDGLNWAVLFNSDENADKKRIAALVDPLVHRAVNSVKTWPVVGE